jgi:hypothetical protein
MGAAILVPEIFATQVLRDSVCKMDFREPSGQTGDQSVQEVLVGILVQLEFLFREELFIQIVGSLGFRIRIAPCTIVIER